MLSLVSLSGSEFIDALLRGGFAVHRCEGALMVLGRGEKTVVVCESAMLSADDLVYLLRRAGVAYFELLDLLAAGKTMTATKSGFHRRYEPAAAGSEAPSPRRSLAELVEEANAAHRR